MHKLINFTAIVYESSDTVAFRLILMATHLITSRICLTFVAELSTALNDES